MSITVLDRDFSDYRPAFSPDGKRIVFERTLLGSSIIKLWVYNRETGVSHPFLAPGTGPQMQTRADWSFAGNDVVAFAGGEAGGPLSIWTVKGDGTGCLPVPGTEQMIYPAWYPDGEHLAVMVSVSAPYTARIDLAGKPERITPPSVLAGMPSVNQADGKTIACAGQFFYGQEYNQSTNNVWTFDPSAPTGAPKLFNPGQGRAPWWSQDGSKIAFESNFQGEQPLKGYAIYVAPASGGKASQVTDPSLGAQHPKFSKSGEEIVFALHPEPNPSQSPFRIGILSLSGGAGAVQTL
jgi:Tol biopolymer transport system component